MLPCLWAISHCESVCDTATVHEAALKVWASGQSQLFNRDQPPVDSDQLTRINCRSDLSQAAADLQNHSSAIATCLPLQLRQQASPFSAKRHRPKVPVCLRHFAQNVFACCSFPSLSSISRFGLLPQLHPGCFMLTVTSFCECRFRSPDWF